MNIVFDIGGTNMRIALTNKNKILKTISIPTSQNFSKAMILFEKTAKKLLANKKCQSSAGGVPGPLDINYTKIINAPNLSGWNNKPLKKSIEKILNCPVVILKDVHAAALGEAMYGAGINKRIVVYYTISTGIGGARVIDGRIDDTTALSELGFQVTKYDESKGNIEALVSGTGMKERYGKKASQIKSKKIWIEAANFLAIAVHNTIIHWCPDIVILGGSVMESLPIKQLQKKIETLPRLLKKNPPIVKAKLKDEVGLYGAIAFINKNKKGA